MTGALYRFHQWRHGYAKRRKIAPRIEESVAIINKHFAPRVGVHVLSVGPRNLHEVIALERFGEVDAIDLFPTHPRIRRGDIHALPADTGSADLVSASHVVEHSRDLAQAAREIARVTKPGGFVWIAVPAGQAPNAHDRHRFDTILDVVDLFAAARPELLFEEVRPGRDVRVLMRLHKDGPKRILYVLPDAFAVRNVEASGLLLRLTERGHQVAALCGTQGVELIKGVTCGALALYLGSRLRQWARRGPLRTLSYLSRSLNGEVTYRTKLALRRAWRQRLEIAILRPVAAILDGERVGRWVERRLPVDRGAKGLVERLRPDVVVVHTSIYAGDEAEIVKWARCGRVPVIAQVASWDPLTAKGGFLVRPDVLAVWGEASRTHAIERHGFAPAQVVVTGPCHFDQYGENPDFRHWTAEAGWWTTPTLAPSTRLILIAGSTLAYWNTEVAMVERIARWAEGRDIHVWYRPHPRHHGRPVSLPKLNTLTVDESGLDAPPAHYRRLLEQAVCTIAAFSTMVVESALMGKPSLVVAFGDSTGGSEYGDTPRGRLVDHAGFEHMAEVLTWRGVVTCRTEHELFSGLEYFTGRLLTGIGIMLREERARALQGQASRIAHCLDGGATARMVALIERVAR